MHLKRLQRLRDIAEEVTTTDRLHLISLLIDRITDLLEGEVGGWNEYELSTRQARITMRPLAMPNPSGALTSTFSDHPLVAHYIASPTLSIVRLSDVVSLAELKRTRTFAEVYRPMGTPYVLTIPVRADSRSGRFTALAVTRAGRDFADSDSFLPHAVQAMLIAIARAPYQGWTDGATRLPLRPAGCPLTPREWELLCLLSLDWSISEIARRMNVKRATVEMHRKNIYRKLEVQTRIGAARQLHFFLKASELASFLGD